MRLNEGTAVSTSRVLLVPYDRHHVVTYHGWMQDPAIQEATASEPLTLEEEYENQESWRASHDKLTFIICRPAGADDRADGRVEAGVVGSPDRMVGDINFFLHPWDEDDDEDEGADADGGGGGRPAATSPQTKTRFYVGEVDVMVADKAHRGEGVGKAAAAAFLRYIGQNLNRILAEHHHHGHGHRQEDGEPGGAAALKLFMAKIKADNHASLGLFRGLGFEQQGDVDYFGEVKMVLRDVDGVVAQHAPPGYQELEYRRSAAVA